MISRNRFLITATLLCHLILIPPLLTSQLRSGSPQTVPADRGSTPQVDATQPSLSCSAQAKAHPDLPTICAVQQEKIGQIYKLHGAAEIYYHSYILKADEMTYNSDTSEAEGQGHLTLDGGPNDDHIRADHGTYNVDTETGKFYDVTGTTGLRFKENTVLLTSSSPFAFTGKVVIKDRPDHYIVYDGTVTTCSLPHPKCKFDARKVSVDVGGNANIYNSVFLVHGLPIFYFPFATHPVEPEVRKSGFLIPSISRSSIKGDVLGDSFYWAINRSLDATLGGEYFSMRGWEQQGQFRARPTDHSYVDLTYFGVIDRGIGYPPQKQGGEEPTLKAVGNVAGFRAVADIDYLSSYLFREAFSDVFTQAVNSEVKSRAFISRSNDGFFLSGFVGRYQNFQLQSCPVQTTSAGTCPTTTTSITEQAVAINHIPAFDFAAINQKLAGSPFYWSADMNVADLFRGGPGYPAVHPTGRLDFNPEVSVPLHFRGWSLRPGVTLHETYYSKRLIDSGTPFETTQNNPINRQAVEADVELRPPALERVFQRPFLGRKWKHVIEPLVNYRYVTGINNFHNILRFDDRDILSDANEVEYGLTTRLFAKRELAIEPCDTQMSALLVGKAAPEQSTPWGRLGQSAQTACLDRPQTREVVNWELLQKYFLDPTFGGALVPGQRNVFATTIDLTGIAFATQARHLSPLVSRLRVETSDRTDAEWDLDYDFQLGRIDASTLLANYHIGPFTIGGGDAFLQVPLTKQPQLINFPSGEISPTCSVPTQIKAGTCVFQQFRVGLGYGSLTKRGLSAATSFGIDAETGILQFASAQTTYNWDCCGVTLEYRRYYIANVRNENLFRFNFNLANIGSFGNLRRQERLY